MPKQRNDYAWFKWHPGKARTSARWLQLTLEEEGYYHRLYDMASLSQPASKRGWLYADGVPLAIETVHRILLIEIDSATRCLARLQKLGLISRNTAGAYGFPDFAKHQRGANLQPRKSETKPRHKRDVSDATDIDIDIDADTDNNNVSCAEPRTDGSTPDDADVEKSRRGEGKTRLSLKADDRKAGLLGAREADRTDKDSLQVQNATPPTVRESRKVQGGAENAIVSCQSRSKPLEPQEVMANSDQARERPDATLRGSRKVQAGDGSAFTVPDMLVGLELYEIDRPLCRKLPGVIAAWEAAFPGVDIKKTISVAHGWEVSNPKKRKRNKVRFLFNWLSREQDRPRTSPNQAGNVSRRFASADSQPGKFEGIGHVGHTD